MLRENLLTATLKKRKAAFWLFIAAALFFSVFAFLENPLKSTISDIGRTRLPLLAVYCIILPLCDIVNVEYMLRAFKLKAPVLRTLFFVSNVCVGFVVTTLMPALPEKTVSTFSVLLHWLTGFGNIVLNATVVLVLCLRLFQREKSRKGKVLFITGTALCVADLLFFVVMSAVMGGVKEGKNGLYEIIPIVATHIVLFAVNHTNLFSPKAQRDSEESSIKAQDTSVFSAVAYFFLAAAWLFFTFYSFVRNPISYTISMTGLDYPLGFGVAPGGGTTPDMTEPIRLVRELHDEQGLSMVNLTMGNPYATTHVTRPFDFGKYETDEHPFEGLSRMICGIGAVKKAVPEMTVWASAPTYLRAYSDLFSAGAVEQGFCDGMLFGRMAFADPDFANEIVKHGRIDPNRVCLTCGKCGATFKKKA